jgi:hypothetical protein
VHQIRKHLHLPVTHLTQYPELILTLQVLVLDPPGNPDSSIEARTARISTVTDLPEMTGYAAACSSDLISMAYSEQFAMVGTVSNAAGFMSIKPDVDTTPRDVSLSELQSAPLVPYLPNVPAGTGSSSTGNSHDDELSAMSQYYFQPSVLEVKLESSVTPPSALGESSSTLVAQSSFSGSPPASQQIGDSQSPPSSQSTFSNTRQSDVPVPPKKPLTPYMRFSKGVSKVVFALDWLENYLVEFEECYGCR